MIVKGTGKQLILNLTLMQDNNFTGKEKERVSQRGKYTLQMKTMITQIFMFSLLSQGKYLFSYQEKQSLSLHGDSFV